MTLSEYVPAEVGVHTQVATPTEIVPVQIVVPESLKVNVPVAPDGVTVAVKVTVFPATTVDGETESALEDETA